MINYIDIAQILHIFHIAIHEGNYFVRLKGWLEMIPYFFGLNRTNYSRYGSYSVCQMLNLDNLFPGCKDLLIAYGISVQGQDRYPLKISIDQRGEQTFNRDAKTSGGISGGITNCASSIENVTKCTLNRSSQGKITAELKAFAGLSDSDYTYKPLQPSNMIKSNYTPSTLVGKILEGFVNPFGKELLNSKLYNFSSGIPVEGSVADRKVFDDGKKYFKLFVDERRLSNQKNLHATSPRLQVKRRHSG